MAWSHVGSHQGQCFHPIYLANSVVSRPVSTPASLVQHTYIRSMLYHCGLIGCWLSRVLLTPPPQSAQCNHNAVILWYNT